MFSLARYQLPIIPININRGEVLHFQIPQGALVVA